MSYDLLSAPEQVALARVSVFAGWVPLALAEAVVGGDGIVEAEALDLIDELVAKSLVVAEMRAEQAGCRLLETLRDYGAAKLADAGEETIRRPWRTTGGRSPFCRPPSSFLGARLASR